MFNLKMKHGNTVVFQRCYTEEKATREEIEKYWMNVQKTAHEEKGSVSFTDGPHTVIIPTSIVQSSIIEIVEISPQ